MVKVFFATNRNHLENDPKYFGEDYSQRGDLRFGTAIVDTSTKAVSDVKLYENDEKLGSMAMFKDIQGDMKSNNRDTVIYIHGYNTNFTGSLWIAARCVECAKAKLDNEYDCNIIVFSWPSDGKLMKYMDDRKDAAVSRLGLYRALMKYYNFIARSDKTQWCNRKLNLICHSMGNYVFRNGIQEMLKETGSIKMFNEILLISADEDNDAFEYDFKLAPLVKMAGRVTVYFNRYDGALFFSDHLKGNAERLGVTGPINANTISQIIKPVDVERVVPNSPSTNVSHGYHIDDKCGRVHADIGWTLKGTPSEEISGRKFVPQANKYVILKEEGCAT